MEKIDIELLKKIKDDKFNFAGMHVLELTHKLMNYIGDHDPEVRDGLVYPVLAHLLHDDVLSNEELCHITEDFLTDKYLFYDINNKEEFSVLTRSFTVLQLAVIVYKHNMKPILSEEQFKKLVKDTISYFEQETDFRGFVEDIGWLHSIAHAADLFSQLMRNKQVKEKDLKKIFRVIQNRFMIHEYQFIHDEDERMINGIEHAIKRDILPKEFVIEWIKGFKKYERGDEWPEAYHITLNIKRFLRSMYFRFLNDINTEYISEICKEVLFEVKI